jgi:hypothetical protein
MALSILSSVNSNITKYSNSAPSAPIDSMAVWLKFDTGDLSGSSLINYGTAGNCTVDTAESYQLSISTSNKKVGTGCLNTGGTTTNNNNLITIPAFNLTGNISFAFWVYIDSSVFNPRILQFNCAGVSYLCIRYLNALFWDVLDGGINVSNNQKSIDGLGTFTGTNTWNHVVIMYKASGTNSQIWINNKKYYDGVSSSNFGTINGMTSTIA